MKLSIRKKNNTTGNAMTSNNYDMFIDGEEVNGKDILGFELVMPANEIPKLTINYRVTELEIKDLEVKSMTKDWERMQELGGCIAEGLKQGINQTANIPIKIPSDINPKEPYEFVARINGSPLTQCRKQNLRSH